MSLVRPSMYTADVLKPWEFPVITLYRIPLFIKILVIIDSIVVKTLVMLLVIRFTQTYIPFPKQDETGVQWLYVYGFSSPMVMIH